MQHSNLQADGCSVSDTQTATTSTTQAACTPTPTALTSDNGCAANSIVYPRDPYNVGEIPSLLADYAGKYEQLSTPNGYTVYFWIPLLDRDTLGKLKQSVCSRLLDPF